jgi:hypothetical protein
MSCTTLTLRSANFNPGEADCLLNDVCSEMDELAQFLVLERYLSRKLKSASAIHPAVKYAVEQLSHDSGMRVGQIQLDTGLSHTRFIQLFHEHVGLTPKLISAATPGHCSHWRPYH